MKFSAEWLQHSRSESPELKVTTCLLAIDIGSKRVSQFLDRRRSSLAERIAMSALPIAEGFAFNWWWVVAGRSGELRMRRFREGFAIPDIRLVPDGRNVEIIANPSEYSNPAVVFFEKAEERISSKQFVTDVRLFIEGVVGQLTQSGVVQSPLQERWQLIVRTLEDSDERAFCMAAGALNIDPYTCTERDAATIERASELFHLGALQEFLADQSVVEAARNIEWVVEQEQQLADAIILPDLPDWSEKVHRAVDRSMMRDLIGPVQIELDLKDYPSGGIAIGIGEASWSDDFNFKLEHSTYAASPWMRGYLVARAARRSLSMPPNAVYRNVLDLAKLWGGERFHVAESRAPSLRASTDYDGKRIKTIVSKANYPSTEVFALARAVGDFLVFDSPGRAPITKSQSFRQAVGRAFAAEFLAPMEQIVDMKESGLSTEEIALERGVSEMVVMHQIENYESNQGKLAN